MPDPGNLYIRWSQTGSDDNRTDPGGGVWWLSRSVRVVNPADPAQDPGLALTGTDQKVRVEVDTLLSTTNVAVQVWACAYGTAGQPFLPSANGVDGLIREVDDALNPFTAQPAPPAAQLAVDLPWRPLVADLTAIGAPTNADLHVCLLANCFSTAGQGDGVRLVGPARPPIDVASNRHHAQHNISVRPVVPKMGKKMIQLFAGNPFAEGEDEFVLEVAETRQARLSKRELGALQRGRWLVDDPKLGGRGGALRPATEPLREVAATLAGEKSHEGAVRGVLTADDPQLLAVSVVVEDAEPGTLHVLDVVQRTRKRIVGGARLLLLVVDEERYVALTPERAAAH